MPRGRRRNDRSGSRLHILDMGYERYGDCLLFENDGRTILIDGGHPGDWRARDGFKSIPEQMEEILGHGPPLTVDLLVITHCHSDHIGCLPTLVERGILKADWALAADERLGFGRAADYVRPDMPGVADRLAAALREEDYSDLGDDELEAFLEDVATLEDRYSSMLAALESAGTHLIRFGRDDHLSIEDEFQAFGLEVLGPSRDQLLKCAEAIARFNERAPDFLTGVAGADKPARMRELYREIVKSADEAGAEDRPGKGAAVNDQSIVLKVQLDGASLLVAGDMQFAVPEVTGLERLMAQLRSTVRQKAPFQLIKLSHHASDNGFDESLLQEWASTNHYVHSGGINDAKHPDEGVLRILEENSSRLWWARTDRNGRITTSFPGGQPEFSLSRGDLNDPTPNADVSAAQRTEAVSITSMPAQRTISTGGGLMEVTASAKTGPDVTRVTVTFDVTRAETTAVRKDRLPAPLRTRPGTEPHAEADRLAGGRSLRKLLFVTHVPGLANNLGQTEAATALQTIRQAGQTVLEIRNPHNPYPEVRRMLERDFAGVVILGGYDVLPSQRVDALPPSLRAQLGSSTSDADNFIVWNDEIYGDRDGDRLPEVPVSRIPDAKSPRLVKAALTAGSPQNPPARFGVRNSARPFAAGPYGLLPGNTALLVSAPASPSSVGAGNARGSHVYFMLHGSDVDASRFWGEDNYGTVEAVNISNIPRRFAGVVLTGCCWGALTVQVTAASYVPGQPVGVRTPGTSIALSYLHAGAKGFVGCTGTHYSPTVAPYRYFGGPMHEAFWKSYTQGAEPAEALFQAKIDYLQGLPHGQTSPMGQAIEFKIWKQFTCLGLGW